MAAWPSDTHSWTVFTTEHGLPTSGPLHTRAHGLTAWLQHAECDEGMPSLWLSDEDRMHDHSERGHGTYCAWRSPDGLLLAVFGPSEALALMLLDTYAATLGYDLLTR